MSPVCGALSSFGFALWLIPHVSLGWGVGVSVTGASGYSGGYSLLSESNFNFVQQVTRGLNEQNKHGTTKYKKMFIFLQFQFHLSRFKKP